MCIMLKDTEKIDCEITKASNSDLRVYKKTSPNSTLTLYLGSRDVICREGIVEPLRGVIYIDPKFVSNHKIFGQLTLTFRYGREDEEVMGLKFCNEAIISLKQIWPPAENEEKEELTSLQQILIEKLGKTAYPFSLDVGSIAPPSVQLIPAKRYNGAPIGTSYDIRVHLADPNEERLQRRSMVRLGVRVLHKINSSNIAQPSLIQTNNNNNNNNKSLVSSSITTQKSTHSSNTKNQQSSSSASPSSITSTLPKSLRLRLSPKALKLTNKFTNNEFRNTNGTTMSSAGSTSGPVTTGLNINSAGDDGIGIGGGASSRIDKCSTDLQIEHRKSIINKLNQPIFKGPEGSVDKPFLWTEGRVSLRAALNKSAYGHGEHISVTIDIRNDSRKIIRKIRIFAVQHVDVCMFSNGKFKNVVAEINENHQIKPGEFYRKIYSLLPIRGPTKNWIAVEGNPSVSGYDIDMSNYNYKIASSAPRGPQTPDERNVFAIYVSYYIKVKLTLSGMGGEVSLKLPFILGHIDDMDEINRREDNNDQPTIRLLDNNDDEDMIVNDIKKIAITATTRAANDNGAGDHNKSKKDKIISKQKIDKDCVDEKDRNIILDDDSSNNNNNNNNSKKNTGSIDGNGKKSINKFNKNELDSIKIDDGLIENTNKFYSSVKYLRNKNDSGRILRQVAGNNEDEDEDENEDDDDDDDDDDSDKINKKISITTVQIHQQSNEKQTDC